MVKLDQHYVDLRLVALYDIENSDRSDTDFYVQLAAELAAQRIIDLGCGTGVLATALAVDGCDVAGVDPSPAMLSVARQQPGAEWVRWVEGDADALGRAEADLVIMAGHVAQVFLEDDEWEVTLDAVHAALRPGGHLAFESRNPEGRAWERWDRHTTHAAFDSPQGPVETWIEVIRAGEGRVLMEGHNLFKATGEVVVASSELRFRSLEEVIDSLNRTGFTVECMYGDWARGPFTTTSREMIFVARRD